MKTKEKLLILGRSDGTKEALDYAKETGLYTVLTDYLPPEENTLKKTADEYWMTDVSDIDELEERCRRENISGIFAATSEFCLDAAKELCDRLNLPFYASDEGWACARDKLRFKKHCLECGVDTPRIWQVGGRLTEEILKQIRYPVIVKPTDSCAQQGISVCENEAELLYGFEAALEASASKTVMIEDYIVGEEVAPFYFFLNGEAILVELDDLVYLPVNGRNNFVFVKNFSKFIPQYQEKIEPKMKKLFLRMGCRNGAAFLQGIRKEDRVYFLELGYRLDGIGAWKRNRMEGRYSSVELLVDFALGHQKKIGKEIYMKKDAVNRPGGTYLLWARPGKIAKIEGLKMVKGMESVEVIVERFQVGDEIPQKVSMRQVAFCICVIAEKVSDLKEKVARINEALHIYDKEGKDMLYYLTDLESLE